MLDMTKPDSEGIDLILALEPHPNVYIRTSLHNPSLEPLPFRDMWPNLLKVTTDPSTSLNRRRFRFRRDRFDIVLLALMIDGDT